MRVAHAKPRRAVQRITVAEFLAMQKPAKRKRLAGLTPPINITWENWLSHDGVGTFLTVKISGLKLISELNRREHPMQTHKRKKAQQEVVRYALMSVPEEWLKLFAPPVRITITRISPGTLDEGDNLESSGKHVRDEFARFIGINDGDRQNRWIVTQEREGRGVYGCRIRIGRA